jgi:two-component system, LytTR family, response regulator
MIPQSKKSMLIVDYKKNCMISLDEIVFLKGEINYTTFIFKYRRQHTVSYPLKYFEKVLCSQWFLRIHCSYLVNTRFVKSTNSQNSTMLLTDGTVLKVARRRRQFLEKK